MPRWADALLAGVGLVLVSPLIGAIALAVRTSSRGPVIYRQLRVGRGGRPFVLYKFRTMVDGAEAIQRLTLGDADPRITAVGRLLRRHKLDELPQLFNVLRGDMALVGPRPEVPEFVRADLPDQQALLRHRPGLTDPASLRYRHEARLLAANPDPVAYYLHTLLPTKAALSAEYLRRRSVGSDLRVILATLARLF